MPGTVGADPGRDPPPRDAAFTAPLRGIPPAPHISPREPPRGPPTSGLATAFGGPRMGPVLVPIFVRTRPSVWPGVGLIRPGPGQGVGGGPCTGVHGQSSTPPGSHFLRAARPPQCS